jgi:hypothetical protein
LCDAYKEHLPNSAPLQPKDAAARTKRLATQYPAYSWCLKKLDEIADSGVSVPFSMSNIRGVMQGLEKLDTKPNLSKFLQSVAADEFAVALGRALSQPSLPEKGPYAFLENTLLDYTSKEKKLYGTAAEIVEKASGTMLSCHALIGIAESRDLVKLPSAQPELFAPEQTQEQSIGI